MSNEPEWIHNERTDTCRYHELGSLKEMQGNGGHYCTPEDCATLGDRWERKYPINPETCLTCERYKSRYITYPVTVSGIDVKDSEPWDLGLEPVRVRKATGRKTYFGIYLGMLPYMPNLSYNEETQRMTLSLITNPCIYVPELNEIVYGAESWWGRIEPGEDISDITDETIRGQWYMKLLEKEAEDEGIPEGSL